MSLKKNQGFLVFKKKKQKTKTWQGMQLSDKELALHAPVPGFNP